MRNSDLDWHQTIAWKALTFKKDNLLSKLLRVGLTLCLINTARHFVPQVVFSGFLFLCSVAVNNVAGELPHLEFLT